MKVLTLREIRLRFKLSKACTREIRNLYLFGAGMGALAGLALGLAFQSLVADTLSFCNWIFNVVNAFLLLLDPASLILGFILGGGLFFYQHWDVHHKAECCKKHNMECDYQK